MSKKQGEKQWPQKDKKRAAEGDVGGSFFGRSISMAQREAFVTILCHQLLRHLGSNSIY